ncbi:MAG: hypothetical protein KBG92_00765 [Spirochaetes bacterium]|nr:hypothetical protein [Spirochaetota bacterium]MBP8986309.1 hypothetical protein [Spirochaetota bacterium]HQL44153.1 hypothetical protein [Spirochaetota bacterium]
MNNKPVNTNEAHNDNDQLHFASTNEALYALNMYMNRFMWISTREIVSGISSWYYNDIKGEKTIK